MKKIEALALAGLVALSFSAAGCQEKAAQGNPAAELQVKQEANQTGERENVSVKVAENGEFKTFTVYSDANAPDNHYTPSGWMGDFGDIKINEQSLENPHGGSTSIQVSYSGKASQGAGWSGVYWQNPSNNWGTRPGGYDLTGAKQLTFWARGEKGGERIEEFKLGGITGEYGDSDAAGIGPVVLTPEWKQYSIDLSGKDLSTISGGFCWVLNKDSNANGAVFYLDDIRYE